MSSLSDLPNLSSFTRRRRGPRPSEASTRQAGTPPAHPANRTYTTTSEEPRRADSPGTFRTAACLSRPACGQRPAPAGRRSTRYGRAGYRRWLSPPPTLNERQPHSRLLEGGSTSASPKVARGCSGNPQTVSISTSHIVKRRSERVVDWQLSRRLTRMPAARARPSPRATSHSCVAFPDGGMHGPRRVRRTKESRKVPGAREVRRAGRAPAPSR